MGHNGPALEGQRTDPVKVLLVEDCAGDVLLTRTILAELPIPIKLQIARNGLQGLLMLGDREFKPDLVILDLSMPEVSGHSLLERYHPKDVPVVVFSSSWSETDKRQALALGARDYIHKPMDAQEFREAVRGMIERWVLRKGGDAASEATTS